MPTCLVAEGENMFLASADPSNSDIPRKTMIRLNKQEKLLLLSLLGDFTAAELGVVRLGFILTTLGDDSNQYTNGVCTDNGASGAMVVRDPCCLFSGTFPRKYGLVWGSWEINLTMILVAPLLCLPEYVKLLQTDQSELFFNAF